MTRCKRAVSMAAAYATWSSRRRTCTIPKKDIGEPVFHHGQGGIRDTVHPGNTDYVRGDRIARPKGGGGGGSGQGPSQRHG